MPGGLLFPPGNFYPKIMKSQHCIFIFLVYLLSVIPSYSQLQVFEFIDTDSIIVDASSTYSGACMPKKLLDGSGLTGILHDNDMSAYTMWHSQSMPSPSKAFPNTKHGSVWLSFTLKENASIKEIWIWNHNQPSYTGRGLNKIYIEYSIDGENWKLLKNKGSDQWNISEASGENGQEPNLIADFEGNKAKYIVITADVDNGNYGDDYYGLSEIRFVARETSSLQSRLDIKGTDQVSNKKGEQFRHHKLYISDGIAYGQDQLIIGYAGMKDTVPIIADAEPFHDIGIDIPFNGDYNNKTSLTITSKNHSFKKEITIEPPREWNIYLFPQSHVDLGYTHTQEKVKELHFEYFEYAIELAKKTRNYPEDSRFKWNTEILWAFEHYLKEKPIIKRKEIIDAVRKGWINLDGTYAHINTSLCNSEQLLQLFEYSRYLENRFDIVINSAQQVDIPGLSWGIVPAMTESGIEYMLNMPNIVDDQSLENHPFYWTSPSGKSRILHFETYYYNLGYHLKGRYIPNYLSGSTEPNHADNPDKLFLNPFIFKYLEDIKTQGYIYEMIPFAWIMTDNAPPDPDLPDVVRNWNNKYSNPRVIISSVSRFFRDFENKYKDVIPEMSGDYTEYWTDGVASGASETSINRNNAERILQMETLYAMLCPRKYDRDRFYNIWKNILLFAEHTWGSYKSTSHPDDPDVLEQWRVKSKYALDAEDELNSLVAELSNGEKITVYNTNSWDRTEICIIPEKLSLSGDLVIDETGDTIISQRLTTGELAIYAENILAYGKKSFSILSGRSHQPEGIKTTVNSVSSEFFSLAAPSVKELVIRDNTGKVIFRNLFESNDRYYRYCRRTGNQIDTVYAKLRSVKQKEKGPLVGSFLLEYDAPGCDSYTAEIRILYQKDYLEFINLLEKQEIRTKEKASLNFAFDCPTAQVSYEIPGGIVRPDEDLLPGSNTSFYTVQHFVDASVDSQGYTLVCQDAPVLQIERTREELILESVLVDNNWHVNFRASQKGPLQFRYYIRGHEKFNSVNASKFGLERFQPLVVLPSDKVPDNFALLEITGHGIVAASCKPSKDTGGTVVRLYNTSGNHTSGSIKIRDGNELWESNINEKKIKRLSSDIQMAPHEFRTILITRN